MEKPKSPFAKWQESKMTGGQPQRLWEACATEEGWAGFQAY